ncbi:programmed cell death 4-like isoform X1 [Pelobates cultripes]|uniref:Programmed cell death 4-like isoform X1 n=1 Tax=Pelobates cultripes TaxID=61616 RepID=A0AAD1SCX2_PELCU|nr:programmed cell death 4-like isoform X1 [Pelobates cultripes]
MSNSAVMGPGEDGALDEEEMSEEEVSRDWTPQEKALHEAKVKARAKYRVRRTSSRDSESTETIAETPIPQGKSHDRKSRMGKGRGLPKKGGAGGKGVWGALGQVYTYQEPDVQDPNYDESAQGKTVYHKVVPELDEVGLQHNVQPMVREYFEHGDTEEVIMLGQFIARAVADHALPLNFLDRYKGRVDCDHARAAVDRAAVLLRIKREIIRLDNVWGVGGGQRPVKHLIKEG